MSISLVVNMIPNFNTYFNTFYYATFLFILDRVRPLRIQVRKVLPLLPCTPGGLQWWLESARKKKILCDSFPVEHIASIVAHHFGLKAQCLLQRRKTGTAFLLQSDCEVEIPRFLGLFWWQRVYNKLFNMQAFMVQCLSRKSTWSSRQHNVQVMSTNALPRNALRNVVQCN